MIYADNAATTKISKHAQDVMISMMNEYWGNPSSLHTPGQLANEKLYEARKIIAECINAADPRFIYFTATGSEADNQALITGARLGLRKGKKRIISTTIEHHAILHTLDRLKSEGYEIVLVPVDESGIVSVDDIENAINDETALVSVMFANNEIGTIQPIKEIGAVCKKHNVLFHTDAVQAAGHEHIDVQEMNIDMLSMSGHKFNGPRGVGALYARKGILPYNIITGGAQERGRRAGTENLPAIYAMAVALKDACDEMDSTNEYLKSLTSVLIDKLSTVEHSSLNGDREKRLSSNVSFCFEGIEGESILLLLNEKGIFSSSGSACTSGSLDPSHVLLAIGRDASVAHGSVRLTFSKETTIDDINYIAEELPKIVEYLRNMSPVWKELQAGEREYML